VTSAAILLLAAVGASPAGALPIDTKPGSLPVDQDRVAPELEPVIEALRTGQADGALSLAAPS